MIAEEPMRISSDKYDGSGVKQPQVNAQDILRSAHSEERITNNMLDKQNVNMQSADLHAKNQDYQKKATYGQPAQQI